MKNDQNILSFTPGISAKVEFPESNSKHPENTEEPEIRETYISWVFITEKYINKLKKTVRQNSPDLRIPESRHRTISNFYKSEQAFLLTKFAIWHIREARYRDNPEWVILTNKHLQLAGHYGGLLAH